MEIQDLTPSQQRDALLDLIPALVDRYGNVSSSTAADWYDQVREAWLESEELPDDGYRASTSGSPYDHSVLQDEIRYRCDALFPDSGKDPTTLLTWLNGRLGKWIQQAGRNTVIDNVASDPSRPRYARVPQGAETCAFCCMLASRGFVYSSAQAAGQFRRYHDLCDCAIVPSWDKDNPKLDGYDPDSLYEDYLKARDETGKENPSESDVLAAMRQHAGVYSDSILGATRSRYRLIIGAHSLEDDLTATNPHYREGREWQINCQRCVNAYEARRRGYDVTAKPAPLNSAGTSNDPADALPRRDDPAGWPHVYEDAELTYLNGRTGASERRQIEKLMSQWGDGARAIIRVAWKGGGAHVFIAEQEDGQTRFIDPQIADTDVSRYFGKGKIRPRGTAYMRVDDKEFTDLLDECCEEVQ